MALSIDDLKTSLVIDEADEADDRRLSDALVAAESYVQDAVGAPADFFETDGNASLYKIVVLAVAGSYYQNPVSMAISGTAKASVVEVDLVLHNIINQLRARWEVASHGATDNPGAADQED